MKVGGILKLIEDLLFELLSWVLFIPKTFLMALQPGRAQRCVSLEWASEKEEIFDEYVSTVLFYIGMNLLGVLEVAASIGEAPFDYLGRLFQVTDFVLLVMASCSRNVDAVFGKSIGPEKHPALLNLADLVE